MFPPGLREISPPGVVRPLRFVTSGGTAADIRCYRTMSRQCQRTVTEVQRRPPSLVSQTCCWSTPSWKANPRVSVIVEPVRGKPAPARPAFRRLGLSCQVRPWSRETYRSIRLPDRKMVSPGLADAPPRYPPDGGLAIFRQLRPPSSDNQAALTWLPAPGSSPQPRNSQPPGAAASAPDHAPRHGSGTGRQRAEPFTGPDSSKGFPRSSAM